MEIQHFLITRFSIRLTEKNSEYGQIDRFKNNPIKKKYVNYRLKLFEFSCLPSIRGQSSQDFIWIILIDQSLEDIKKHELKELVKNLPNVKVVDFKTSMKLDGLNLLRPMVNESTKYLLTTNIDDDDILPINFVEEMHNHLINEHHKNNLPPIKYIGFKKLIEWDYVKTNESIFGYKSVSQNQRISSCGMSLFCKYPEYPFSVMLSRHDLIDKYLQFSENISNPKTKKIQKIFLEKIEKNRDSISQWTKNNSFFDISEVCGPVIMTNHFLNATYNRLYRIKRKEKKISGPESFIGYSIDWKKAEEHIQYFEKKYFVFYIRKIRYQFAKIFLKWDM